MGETYFHHNFFLIAVGLIVVFVFWQYNFYLTSKWNKEDRQNETIALNDITKADSIARELFKVAAYAKHSSYFNSSGCGFNHIKKGIDILRTAAENGNPDAQFTLGSIYNGAHYELKEPKFIEGETMLNEKIDPTIAAYWYSLAAKQGHLMALINLGNAYRKGIGVEQDLVAATELIQTAAERGDSSAQLTYGDMFKNGEVCARIVDSINREAFIIKAKPNIILAKEWWRKALRNGNDEAKERLEKIY